MREYNHTAIEPKWQKKWENDRLYETPDVVSGKENYYLLTEFSYPSGTLHVGHWYAFVVPDILARKRRMEGNNVLYPVGFDALGLPAENAAIKRGVDPRQWTYENIAHMREQLRRMGASFDWSREVVTADPAYYRWTQWLFLKLFNAGLAERKKALVNWCPSCETGLANEQVLKQQRTTNSGQPITVSVCERCETPVVQRELEQWFLKITKYADRLLDDLVELDWPEEIKEAQRNWIGKSAGALLQFPISKKTISKQIPNSKFQIPNSIDVFTTRPDTLFGATYLVLAPEHQLIADWKLQIANWDEVESYIDAAKRKGEFDRLAWRGEKTGVELKGVKAVNPANGEELPIFVADYVLAYYGTGAVMGVPGHDERDYGFAKQHDLPIRYVVAPHRVDSGNPPIPGKRETPPRKTIHAIVKNAKTGKYLCLKWKKHPWTTFVVGGIDEGESAEAAARREVREETGYKNLKCIRALKCPVQAEYFAAHKDENRIALTHGVFFELEDEEREIVSEEEFAKHEISWEDITDLPQNFICAELDIWLTYIGGTLEGAFIASGVLVNSGEFSGLSSEEAKRAITERVGGKLTATYRLRDWLVSRQRYWGCPIPMVYDPEGKAHPVPEEHLPWLLPEDVTDFTPKGTSPLGMSRELALRTERIFGPGWRPEIDTLDTFVDSSWYFLRYLDPHNTEEFTSCRMQALWMPVDRYSGGAEHTTMHVLYARFFYKVLYDLGLTARVKTRDSKISNFQFPISKQTPNSKIQTPNDEPFAVRMNRGIVLGTDGRKMSKRWGNVIDPDAEVARVGADAVRLYLAFIGPYNEAGHYPWQTGGLIGMRRFLERVWRLSTKHKAQSAKHGANGAQFENVVADERLLHRTIKKVGEDIEAFKFNTAISALMILVNAFETEEEVAEEYYAILLRLLAPFAPHLAEELWHEAGHTSSIHQEPWPRYDEGCLRGEQRIVVQIDGRVRGALERVEDLDEVVVRARAQALPAIAKYLAGKTIRRTIYVPGRLLNIVLE